MRAARNQARFELGWLLLRQVANRAIEIAKELARESESQGVRRAEGQGSGSGGGSGAAEGQAAAAAAREGAAAAAEQGGALAGEAGAVARLALETAGEQQNSTGLAAACRGLLDAARALLRL
jgi:hypothetical protein